MASALRVQVSPSALFKTLSLRKTIKKNETELAIVIVSNGPGELNTWVQPVAEKLQAAFKCKQYSNSSTICLRLVLVPCPNATGNEKAVAEKWNIFEKIYLAKYFWQLLLNPKKYGFWPKKGIVIFLGGDQFWSILLSARLRYKNIAYIEWIARWPFWNDRIAAMSKDVKRLIPKHLKKRCVVVGDLMADIEKNNEKTNFLPNAKWIALLPGSKKAKLSIGVPFFLEVVDHLSKLIKDVNFLIPIAPTTSIEEIYHFSSSKNKFTKLYSSTIVKIETETKELPLKILYTNMGSKIYLIEKHPAHNFLCQCDLAITTVGANTSELGALCLPMIVVLPTQHLNVMEAWDGFLGIIGRIPILKNCIGWLISYWKLRNKKFMAWPNITANKMIIPERVGNISPKKIAEEACYWINSPEKLKRQKEDLRSLRGKQGAVLSLSREIINLISEIQINK